MAILSKDDYFSRLHERLAEDTSDDAVKFLEDMTDTYNDLDSRASGDGTDWEKKYHDRHLALLYVMMSMEAPDTLQSLNR